MAPGKEVKNNQMKPTKQDIISRAINAVMHILHDSHLYGSDLWPEHGFKTGISRDKISDIIDVYISAGVNDTTKKYYQSMHFNIMNVQHKRSLDQAKSLDNIFDKAIYDGVYFESSIHPSTPYHYRFSSRGIVRSNLQYIQLPFTFTIND